MKKRIMVLGYKGNMGTRYTRILDYLGVDWGGMDLTENKGFDRPGDIDGIIDAGPTRGRLRRLYDLDPKTPVLAEKPFTLGVIDRAYLQLKTRPIQMVNQYVHMGGHKLPPGDSTLTYYNYFKHGGDGIAFDCINILGLATGRVILQQDSPIWKCELNGRSLSISDMDFAYIAMIEAWLKQPTPNWDYIVHAHKVAHEYEENFNRNSGAFDVREVAA